MLASQYRKNGEDKETAEVTISWSDAEKRLRQLIEEGRYLTPEELEQYRQTHPEQTQMETAATPEMEPLASVLGSTDFQTDYNALKEAHPGNIVLYQIGDSLKCSGRMRVLSPLSWV